MRKFNRIGRSCAAAALVLSVLMSSSDAMPILAAAESAQEQSVVSSGAEDMEESEAVSDQDSEGAVSTEDRKSGSSAQSQKAKSGQSAADSSGDSAGKTAAGTAAKTGRTSSGHAAENSTTKAEENSTKEAAEGDSAAVAEEKGSQSLSVNHSDYTVTVTYDASAKIPKDAELKVSEYKEDSAHYEKLQEKTEAVLEQTEGKSAQLTPSETAEAVKEAADKSTDKDTTADQEEKNSRNAAEDVDEEDIVSASDDQVANDSEVEESVTQKDEKSDASQSKDASDNETTATESSGAVTVTINPSGENTDGEVARTLRAFNVSILSDGEEIEPETAIQVEITLKNMSSSETGAAESASVVHYGTEKTDVLADNSDVDTHVNEEKGTAKIGFTVDSLSDITVTWHGNDGKDYGPGFQIIVDPTNGTPKLYGGAKVTMNTSNNWGVRLPEAAKVTSPPGYESNSGNEKTKYTLHGWYDITHLKWYAPGAWVSAENLTKTYNDRNATGVQAVFYADWVTTTYDIGNATDSDVVPDNDLPKDANGFITNRLYDYNDLFNLGIPSATYEITTDSAGRNTEKWTAIRDPVLDANGNQVYDKNGNAVATGRPLVFASTLGSGKFGYILNRERGAQGSRQCDPSSTNRYYANGVITEGIDKRTIKTAAGKTQTWLDRFFGDGNAQSMMTSATERTNDTSSDKVLGKTELGEADNLFQYNEKSGYYYYDSAKNAATYNWSKHRFYLYNYQEGTSDSKPETRNGVFWQKNRLFGIPGGRTYVR